METVELALEPVERDRMLLNESAYLAEEPLYPVVLTLAMLLPMISRPFSNALRALTPLPSEPMSARLF
jgi:hypothetical protein